MADATQAIPSSAEPPVRPLEIPRLELPRAYRTMVLARLFDDRCLALQRQGRIGFYVPMGGQEAAQVGCTWALDPADWLFPAYRELGAALVRGVPLTLLLDQFIGNSGDLLKGRQMPNHYGYPKYRIVTGSSPVGTQISHAVGAAMAAKKKGHAIVTVPFFGDGTTSSNDFHAGLNFAGVFQAPTIFFCQNNQWAISLPRSRQTRSETLADKAVAYGIQGVVVDGMDVHAVYRAVKAARDRALRGDGPTLIEAQVYRFGPHSSSDDPKRYRPEEDLAAWKARDPVTALQHELLEAGLLTAESDAALWDAARAEIASAIQEAEATAPVDPLSMFDDVLARPTPALEAQRAEFATWLGQGETRT
ncbi:MAG: thiamine pyrophosphate-dependent dehydrogenase E1 component subunit alpha [Thermoplasmata archaeon]|nr:thiamine pyrophosphate-dependent dehydrogenase E1 component subunit alpha [Thermoplasmata archaeon]